MKKKFKVCMLGLCMCMALIFSGCAAKQIMKNQVEDGQEDDVNQEEDQQTEEKNSTVKLEDGTDEETGADEETPETEEQQDTADSSGAPVLGQTGIEDYEGYEYLYCEKIRTQSEKNEESGKMESSELEVFIPQDEYAYVSTNSVRGNYLGVTYDIELNPMIRYNEDDYLLEENLDYLMESEFNPFYHAERRGVEVSEAQKTDDNTAVVEAQYFQYDTYKDEYSPVYSLHFLRELDEGRTVYVQFSIDGNSTTGKTPMLLEEMKQFYDIDIVWNKDEMKKSLEEYLAGGGENTFSTGYLLFDLPEGWKEDHNTGDYTTTVYAPGGDASSANCMITFTDEYAGYNVFKGARSEELLEAVQSYMDEEGAGSNVSYYGETCLGPAVCAILEEDAPEGKVVAHFYWIFSDSYLYRITAIALEGIEENPFLIVEGILENGQVQEY